MLLCHPGAVQQHEMALVLLLPAGIRQSETAQ
jgi:hypothetical protein